MVLRAPRFSLLLKQLHWFPVSYRIINLSSSLYISCSIYTTTTLLLLLHLSNIHRQLSSSISQRVMPKTKLNLGKRAFSVAALRVLNELPITLKTSETIAIFRNKLKTYLFPGCDNDFCAFLFTIMLNDYVFCASELRFPRI